jgi:hypothetical protein
VRIDVYVPLLLSLLLAVASPLAVRYVAPAHAARALDRAALLTPRSRQGCALHFSRFAITRRVTAPRTPPPSSARAWAGALLALAVVPALGAADATVDFLHQLTQALPT